MDLFYTEKVIKNRLRNLVLSDRDSVVIARGTLVLTLWRCESKRQRRVDTHRLRSRRNQLGCKCPSSMKIA